jgi:hypothetical protein
MVVVPELAALLIALMALLLLAAWYLFGKALSHIFPSSIGVGGFSIHPRSWVESGVNALGKAIRWIVGDVIRPMIHLLVACWNAMLHWGATITSYALEAADWIDWAAHHGIPNLAARLEHYAAAKAAHALAAALARLADARAYLHGLIRELRADAYGWVRAARAAAAAQLAHVAARLGDRIHTLRVDAYGWVEGARHYAAHLVTVAESSLMTEIGKVRALVRSEITVVEGYTDTAVADAIKALRHETSVAVSAAITLVDVDAIRPLAAAWPGVIGVVEELEGVIATDLPDIGAAIRAIPRVVPGDLADALAIVGAISIPMLRYMTRCGIPNCRNLSQLGRELAELGDAITAGAFLGLMIALASDPIGTAHFLHDDVGGFVTGAVGEARTLLGA